MIDIASALWNHRNKIVNSKERLYKLYQTVNRSSDLSFPQWIQLYAIVLEFSPDLIIELGRGYGNSTCVFTEAVANSKMGKVVSIGYDAEHAWENTTLPRLKQHLSPNWLDNLHVINENIMKINFKEIVGQSERVLLFWDAHGKELAQYILAHLLPLIYKREHLIIIHDMTDVRHSGKAPTYRKDEPLISMHNIVSSFEEIIPIFDFLSRNGIHYDTPGESITRFLKESDQISSSRSKELKNIWRELVGESVAIDNSHMLYFDINNNTSQSELFFPNCDSIPVQSIGKSFISAQQGKSLSSRAIQLLSRLKITKNQK
ncbi:MAG TPA: hypothetical protein VLA74_05580 [Nitrososphaeraceae archaeon]|nr:hypothetical protein [Nitrososphaeraceae archaeon]